MCYGILNFCCVYREELTQKAFAEMCLSAFYTSAGFSQLRFTGFDKVHITSLPLADLIFQPRPDGDCPLLDPPLRLQGSPLLLEPLCPSSPKCGCPG